MVADTREDFNLVFESSLQSVLPRFGVKEAKDEQKAALVYVLSAKDVFVSLLTGFGKSFSNRERVVPKAKWKRSNCSRIGNFTISI